MSKLRRKFITVLAVLFCALLCLSTALFIPKNKTAEATSISTAIQIDLNTTVNGKIFNREKLLKLCSNILKSDATSYLEFAAAIGSGNGTILKKYTDMTATTVKLGGMDWNVVAASKNQSGQVVVTLWLSIGAYPSYYSDENIVDDVVGNYAPSEYAMSLVRSTLVGSNYATSLTEFTQGTRNPIWTEFLQNYDNFIDSPLAVCGTGGYQALERATGDTGIYSAGISSSLFPNDAYTQMDVSGSSWTTGANHWYNTNTASVQNCVNYDLWKEDKLWLPSLTEAGYNNTNRGLWGINSDTVRADPTVGTNGSWLRSGYYQYANCVYREIVDGTNFGFCGTRALLCTVRPALHLNLSKAYENSLIVLDKPEDVSTTYEGTARTLSDVSPAPAWYDTDLYADSPNASEKPITVTYPNGVNDMIDANLNGYNVKITIDDTNNYCWDDYLQNSSNTREIKYVINKKPIGLIIDEPGDDEEPTAQFPAGAIEQHDIDNGTEPEIEFVYTGGSLSSSGTTNFDNLSVGTYTATAKIKSGTGKNYVLDNTYSVSVTVTADDIVLNDNDIVWRYRNSLISGNSIQTFTADTSGRRAVRYNGSAYTLSIDTNLPQHVFIDTSRGTGGYSNNVQTDYSGTAYTTTVYLKTDTTDYELPQEEYTVTWYIDKGLYDLTSVTWSYSAPFTYDPVNHTSYSVSLNIPAALSQKGLSYSLAGSGSTSSSANAGTFTAIATFTGDANYETPTNGDSDTYIYTGSGDFEWELEWVVEKYTQSFNWNTGSNGLLTQNGDGEEFYLPQPIDPDGMVTVKYYKKEDFDENTKKPKPDAQPIDPDDMIVATSQEQADAEATYFAVLEFIGGYGNNFKFGNGAYMQFNTYDQRQTLTVSISDTEYVFDGNPHADFATEVTVLGATQSDIANYIVYEYFTIVGGVETSLGTTAPTKAGSYKIKVSVNEAGDAIFVINGDSEFAYEIKTLVLEAPSIDGELTYNGQDRSVATLVGIPDGWENYIDVTITRVGFGIISGSTIKETGTYTVIFKIKDGVNVAGSVNSVEWDIPNLDKTITQQVTIKINQLVLHAQGWNESGYYSTMNFSEEGAGQFVVYKVTDADGNEVDEVTVYGSVGEMFVVEVSVGSEHGDNVRIEFANGVTARYEFITLDPDGNGNNGGNAAGAVDTKKQEAKEELEKEAQDKKAAIDADVNLTPEEKEAAKAEIDKELEEGLDAIDAATDLDGVSKALDDGKKEIGDTAELAKKKGAAKSELDKAAQAKKDAIDNDPNLTEEEKAAAKAEVDKELADGKDAIDKATDKNGIEAAENTTKANIENIKPEHKGSFPWWILAVIAGALVLVTVLIIVIVKRRNSDDDDGYDDYYDDEYDYDEEEEVDDDGDEAFGY